jgi:hypothetical protein
VGLPQRQERPLLPVPTRRSPRPQAAPARPSQGRSRRWRAAASSHGVHRLKRVREPCPDLLGDDGWCWRVLRTSSAYNFRDPGPPSREDEPSKANFQSETPNQAFFSSLGAAFGGERTARFGRKEAFEGEIARTLLASGAEKHNIGRQ